MMTQCMYKAPWWLRHPGSELLLLLHITVLYLRVFDTKEGGSVLHPVEIPCKSCKYE